MFENIFAGFSSILTITNITLIFLGTFAGIIVGALPGLSTTMGIALCVPFTFGMDPLSGLALLGGIYNGSVYGGSISAILIRTPGTAASCATTFDGYPMTQKGQGVLALNTALISSLIGGIFGVFVLLFIAPPLAAFALSFGPPEYFMIAVLGLTIIITLSEESLLKGLIGGLLGVFVATIGFDPIVGIPRFTFGIVELYDGIPLIPALIGLFSFAQVIRLIGKKDSIDEGFKGSLKGTKGNFPSWKEWKTIRKTLFRSPIIGTIVGILPGAGADIASIVSYSEAKRNSLTPEQFGTGSIEGLVASEAANNSVVGSSLVPLLTLGVPGNAASAVLLGGLLIHGLFPGPFLFAENPSVVYGFIISLFIANVAMLILGFVGVRVFPLVLKMSTSLLIPVITVLCVTGSYAINNNFTHVVIMLLFGLLGYVLESQKFPLATVILGIILGPMAENGLMQSLVMSRGSWMIFVERPLSLTLLSLTVFSTIYSLRKIYIKKCVSSK